MRHRWILLLMCIVLQSTTTVVKLQPQKIERVVEYRWCTIADGFQLQRVVWMIVEAKSTEPSVEPIITQSDARPSDGL